MTSPSMDMSELSDYAENLISPTLSTIDGVAQVIVYGQKRYAVRVRPFSTHEEAAASAKGGATLSVVAEADDL